MELVKEIGGVPVLGWLVSLQIRDVSLSLIEYGALCDDLEAEFSAKVVEKIRIPAYNRDFRAFTGAVKAVMKEFDANNAGKRRFLLRRPEGRKSLRTARLFHIVEECFTKKDARPAHRVVGRIEFDEGQRAPVFEIDDGTKDAGAMEIVDRFRGAYAAALNNLSAQRLRKRLVSLLAGTAPFAFDPGHLFDFIAVEHEATLRLLQRVVEFCDKQLPASTPVFQRCGVSLFPVPDFDEFRGQLNEAYLANLDEIVKGAETALYDYREADKRDPKDLLSVLDRLDGGKALIEAHAKRLRADVQKVEVALYQLRKMGDVLVGIDRPTARPKGGSSTWKTNRKRYHHLAQEFGDLLVAAGFTPGPTRRGGRGDQRTADQITWSYGTGDDSQIVGVQTSVAPGDDCLAFHFNPDIDLPSFDESEFNGMYRPTLCGGGFFSPEAKPMADAVVRVFGGKDDNNG